MQEEIATVVAWRDGKLELSTKIQSTCGKCEQSSHCGTGLLARYLAPKPENLTISFDRPLLPGQQVKIGMAEALLLKLSALIYLVPMILLVLVATLFVAIFPTVSEVWNFLCALLCCGGYFLLLRHSISNGLVNLGEPQIMQVFEPEQTPIRMINLQ